MSADVDLDALAAAVRALGHEAFVEQTGGGCATLFAGGTHIDGHGETRYVAAAGPGWFDGPDWTLPRAFIGQGGDFCVGPDDDGDNPDAVTWIQPGASIDEMAALVVALIDKARA